jgi:hypothetical protein
MKWHLIVVSILFYFLLWTEVRREWNKGRNVKMKARMPDVK